MRGPWLLLPALFVVSGDMQAHCEQWRYAEQSGQVQKKRIDEASGLVVSRQAPDLLWTLNDEPGDERVFGVTGDGDLVAQLKLRIDSLDWEDLAMGPCAKPNRQCLYIADAGNSEGKRSTVQILRIEEPRFKAGRERFKAKIERDQIEVANFAYADGKNRDAEALMVDASSTFWLFDKNKRRTSLFRGQFDRGTKPGAILKRVARRGDIEMVTAADLSADGSRFIVRNPKHAYEFLLSTREDIGQAFKGAYDKIKLKKERQGEAIGYGADGRTFFTLSEGKREPIHRYTLVPGCNPRHGADAAVDCD
jgi:hypothetical protein